MAVSIIIPAYNEEKYIEKTLKALPKNAEIIVVANNCTDKTAKIAKKYAKVLVLKKKGVSIARNLGAKTAKNNFLVFLDADIIVEKETISKIEQMMKQGIEIGVCKAKPDVDRLFPKFCMFIKNRVSWFGVSTGLIFCTKDVFNNLRGFNETLDKGEDGLFIRQAKKHWKFGVADAYVINSMRRFEKLGYFSSMGFWIKELFRKSKHEYTAVR